MDTTSPYKYVHPEVYTYVFRLISAGTKPGWFGRLLIKWKLKKPELLGLCHSEFPIVLNTDIFKPGDRIYSMDYPLFHFAIKTFPERLDSGYKYQVQYMKRDIHAFVPSYVVKYGARFGMAGATGENPILAK